MIASLSAAEAAARLGVTRQTLYAYVSRGLLAALPGPDHRERRYSREAVDILASDRRRGRRPKEIAKATLDWGLPVLETGLTLIRDGRLYYRGRDAVALARTHSVEAVASLLWQMPEAEAFGPIAPSGNGFLPPSQEEGPGELMRRFVLMAADDDTAAWQEGPGRVAAGCGGLVRVLLASLLGRAPDTASLHEQCAAAWGLDAVGADLVRTALILCADHELNASSFTARCIASTGASLHAAVVGGLAALSGSRHGGMTTRVEAFCRSLEGERRPAAALRRMLAAGVDLPGFGHPLYPGGDVRALAMMEGLRPGRPEPALAEAVFELTGRRASIDFALVALRRSLGLPEGTAFGLFAAGRSVGWIAQALEQRAEGALIRPRAVYVGPEPALLPSASPVDLPGT